MILGGDEMKKGPLQKTCIYFICISFLLMVNGFPVKAVQAKESLPIGEMVSKGDVKFEARDKVWRNVDPSHFPIFEGVKIKTEKGTSILALSSNCQIEVGQNSVLTFDRTDQLHLLQGGIDFRIPAAAAMEFKIGNIFVLPSRSLQASKSPSVPLPKIEEAIGSITIHANGAATVKSLKGSLSILSQDRVVLTALSPRDSVTIPSITVKSPPKIMVAQAGETAAAGDEEERWRFLGLTTWWWVGILAGTAAIVTIVAVSAGGGGGGGGGGAAVPIVCP